MYFRGKVDGIFREKELHRPFLPKEIAVVPLVIIINPPKVKRCRAVAFS
jgi:hypothetical protein